MELAHPLDGLDAHPWSSFAHAYGSAEDVPDHLRALAGSDAEQAGQALQELYGSVLHQGTVYAASAEAVPFLARIAAAGHRTADVLALLGGMAESEDEHGVAPGAVRAAVARQLPLLTPLTAAEEPEVRRAAAWVVSHTRANDTVLPVLLARWDEESDPSARAEVLTGIARLDARAGATAGAAGMDPSQPEEVRLAAVFAHLDAGAPWTEDLHATTVSLLPAGRLRSGFDDERGEPLEAVVAALLGRGREPAREAAFALIEAALRDGRAEVRAEGLWAADRACALSRSAPARLLPGLRAAAVDEPSVLALASLLGRLGAAAAPLADVLLPLAGRNPEQDDDAADRALAALVLVAPRQAAPLLAAGLRRRPRALDAAAGFQRPAGTPFPYDSGLLDAVRRGLSRPGDLGGNEPWLLTALLMEWGADTAPALPELCALLPHHPDQAARVVASAAAHCPPGDRAPAVTALRAAADRGSLAAAKALYDLTDETAPVVRLVADALRGRGLRDAARIAGALGPRGATLAPALRDALSDPGHAVMPALDGDTALAEALWRTTGEADEAVTILDSVFARAEGDTWSRWSVVRAAHAAALLGPAGRPLVPRLEAALREPEQAPAAVVALLAVAEPAAPDRTALAEAALRSAELDADPTGACDALEALVALETLGEAALTADQWQRVTVLADGDARVVRSGVEHRIIPQDEALRTRARALLAAPARPAPDAGT
ncbi:hypothetical protein [Streptomyces sp. NPDC015131]|uniref:hypothetical protein n=1 Tax=Streptomyces sp. NPDC015131 TaxID=3364941 RepID=UPI00370252EC